MACDLVLPPEFEGEKRTKKRKRKKRNETTTPDQSIDSAELCGHVIAVFTDNVLAIKILRAA